MTSCRRSGIQFLNLLWKISGQRQSQRYLCFQEIQRDNPTSTLRSWKSILSFTRRVGLKVLRLRTKYWERTWSSVHLRCFLNCLIFRIKLTADSPGAFARTSALMKMGLKWGVFYRTNKIRRISLFKWSFVTSRRTRAVLTRQTLTSY